MGAANDWDSLLKELAEYHQHAEEELRQQHWEEIKCAGLSPEERTLKDGALFSLEEILQNLASLGADLQKAGGPSRLGLAKANSVSCKSWSPVLCRLLSSFPLSVTCVIQ